jgi:hypothetical protein
MSDKSLTVMKQPNLDDTLRVCNHLAKSGYFRDSAQGAEVSQAVTKVLAGYELGITPIAAITGIHVIKGRIALSANLLATLIKRHPDYDYKIKSLTNDECTVLFFENGEEIGESTFTIEDAEKAGLLKADSGWVKFPRNMLFARAISNGVKWFCPQLTSGAPIYTPEELGENVDEEGRIIEAEIVPDRVLLARKNIKAAWIDKAKEVGLLPEHPTDLDYAELKHKLGQVYDEIATATDGLDELRQAGLDIIAEHAPQPDEEGDDEQDTPLDTDIPQE